MFHRGLAIVVLFAGCTHPPARTSVAVTRPAVPAAPSPTAPAATREATPRVDFARDVRPILEARCQPCHFTGGVMYEALPFDREETVHHLGTKLFTRIKTEEDQRRIRALLSQGR